METSVFSTALTDSTAINGKSPSTVVVSETTQTPTQQRTRTNKDEQMTKLRTLRELYDQGFITQVEYNMRKSQLIDDMTGTKTNGKKSKLVPPVTVTHRAPPDFSTIPAENATKFTFDPISGGWSQKHMVVKVDPEPFAKGNLRKAYHMVVVDEDRTAGAAPTVVATTVIAGVEQNNDSKTYVAKMSIDPDEDRETYFVDAEMQMYASEWAKKFNECRPPKKVSFVSAWILELVDRPEKPLCAVEIYIAGSYRKHNNNFGFVDENERNTPQAFSHFTYEASNHRLLVCDIQGVADMYTDPQMHTVNGIGFGKGNLGPRGFDQFIATHRCNAICKFLKLPLINQKIEDVGTVPATPFMSYQRVNVLNVSIPENSNLHAHINSKTPLLARVETTAPVGVEKDYASTNVFCRCTIL